MARIYLSSVGSLIVLLVLAACGGGNSSSESGGDDGGSVTVSQADCANLSSALTDLQLDSVFGGFRYEKARTFFEDFDVPSVVEDDFEQVQEAVEKMASAFEDAGVKSGDQPVGEQIDELQDELQTSESEQAEIAQAMTSLDAWRSNGCN